MRLLSLSLDVKKLILLFIGFVSLTIFSYSQPNKPIVSEGLFTKVAEYAELIVDGVNKKSTNFQGYFEYSTDKPPIEGEKCMNRTIMPLGRNSRLQVLRLLSKTNKL